MTYGYNSFPSQYYQCNNGASTSSLSVAVDLSPTTVLVKPVTIVSNIDLEISTLIPTPVIRLIYFIFALIVKKLILFFVHF